MQRILTYYISVSVWPTWWDFIVYINHKEGLLRTVVDLILNFKSQTTPKAAEKSPTSSYDIPSGWGSDPTERLRAKDRWSRPFIRPQAWRGHLDWTSQTRTLNLYFSNSSKRGRQAERSEVYKFVLHESSGIKSHLDFTVIFVESWMAEITSHCALVA